MAELLKNPVFQLVAGAILGSVVSAVLSVVITIKLEKLRQPDLVVAIENPPLDSVYEPGRPALNARYLRVMVSNSLPPAFWGWLSRIPALQCRGQIVFHHLDGQDVFGRKMPGRWAGSPEPTAIPVVGPNGVQYQILDFARLTVDSRMDIQPGEATALDVAARFDDEPDCYGWNNEAYLCEMPWRNPKWRLAAGRYLVRITVASAGRSKELIVRLVNDVARQDFRLEQARKEDMEKFYPPVVPDYG